MQVLEALLRLRQAACHPGLIDPRARDEPSREARRAARRGSREVVDEGHKALVFSQFTSLLGAAARAARRRTASPTSTSTAGPAIARRASTRFQNDPAVRLFLISLKAGGLGLNLTAAEYVFLLDPWWNPAVEAQAIDRAHRIGQTRHVFAYRLIARDTVEEKIAELQRQEASSPTHPRSECGPASHAPARRSRVAAVVSSAGMPNQGNALRPDEHRATTEEAAMPEARLFLLRSTR